MKTAKWFLALLLSLILTVSMLPPGALAEDEPTVIGVVVDDMTLYQYGNNGDGQWISTKNEDGTYNTAAWFKYTIAPDTFTIVYSDGSSFTGEGYDIYYKTGKWLVIENDQSIDNQWDIGDYTVPYTFGEFTGAYTVTIVKAPIKSVEVQDIVLRQYVDGWPDAYGVFSYNIDPVVTVTFEDGTTATGTRWQISKQTGYLPVTRQPKQDNELPLGEYDAVLNYCDWNVPFKATVVTAVTSIEWVQTPTQTVIPFGAYVDLSSGIVRVRLSDGTYEDVVLDNQHSDRKYVVNMLGDDKHELKVTPASATTVGEQEITVEFFGKTLSYAATVLPLPESVTLSSKEDHSLSLLFNYEEDSLPMDVLSLISWGGGMNSNNDYVKARGVLRTTGGNFPVTLYKETRAGTVSVIFHNPEATLNDLITSNTITDTWWFDHNNTVVIYGDYNGDGKANTLDLRGLLTRFAGIPTVLPYDSWYMNSCDLDLDGRLDTSDARRILKEFILQ
ncbi:MAG: hypothetical protein IJC52_01905 [Clostridia bacterium]|nr:hypothetical protein [Clostridia bacterium]